MTETCEKKGAAKVAFVGLGVMVATILISMLDTPWPGT